MKMFVVVVLGVVAAAMAAPSDLTSAHAERRNLPALQHEEIHDKLGQYALRYVTAEGTVVSERGRLIPNAEGSGFVMVIEGETTFIGDDGMTYITKYSAGPDGSKVEGTHLPVAPEPLPVEPLEPVAVPIPIVY